MKKEYIVAMAILVLAVAFYLNPIEGSENSDATINYYSQVCTYVNGDLNSCGHNIVTNAGLNHLKEFLGQGNAGSANASIIAVGNGTAPVAGSATLNNEIDDCGFSRPGATYASIGTGNWSLTHTWTSSCNSEVVNTTALFNDSSGGTMFAGNSFTSVTLQANDQLNVTWTIWVTSS